MKLKNFIIKLLFITLMITGLIMTLWYIFYSSTAVLSSDSVITDVIAHQQRINGEFLLKNWYYGNEFWMFSLTIPTYFLSFIIKNNILLRQVSVLITAVIFFVLLYLYGKKFINKNGAYILIAIFLTGISYSVLDYFYAFNAYLTVIINSLISIYLFYFAYFSGKIKYNVLSLILIILLNSGSLRYFPSVSLPLIGAAIIMLLITKKDKKKKICLVITTLLGSLVGLGLFYLLTQIFYYEQRAGTEIIKEINFDAIYQVLKALFECINNFFGFDNKDNPITFLSGTQYFVSNYRVYKSFSFYNFTNIIKIIMAILTIMVTPIVLFANFKKNDEKINFLLLYNTLSWICMVGCYTFTTRFLYNYSELKYFLLNIIINIILFVYVIIKYLLPIKKLNLLILIYLIIYIFSNQYTTYLTIKDNNKKAIEKKYQLVNLLKENNLSFGYGTYWNSLITNYLSDYDITVASIGYYSSINPYRWYSDKRWYDKNYHKGKVFLVYDETFIKNAGYYTGIYGKPDKIIECEGFHVYIYNKNVIADKF